MAKSNAAKAVLEATPIKELRCSLLDDFCWALSNMFNARNMAGEFFPNVRQFRSQGRLDSPRTPCRRILSSGLVGDSEITLQQVLPVGYIHLVLSSVTNHPPAVFKRTASTSSIVLGSG